MYTSQVIIDGDTLYIYLPKNKQLSQGVKNEIARLGWSYDAIYHRVYLVSAVIPEMCTDENPNIRDQAKRHLEASKK